MLREIRISAGDDGDDEVMEPPPREVRLYGLGGDTAVLELRARDNPTDDDADRVLARVHVPLRSLRLAADALLADGEQGV